MRLLNQSESPDYPNRGAPVLSGELKAPRPSYVCLHACTYVSARVHVKAAWPLQQPCLLSERRRMDGGLH